MKRKGDESQSSWRAVHISLKPRHILEADKDIGDLRSITNLH